MHSNDPKRKQRLASALVAVAAAITLSNGLRAGELDPPGPVAPTMKTLVDVEPRRAIRAADLPLEIAEAGSYYLAEHVVAGGAGILISASDVSIDLMGYSLNGGTGSGIAADGSIKNIEIKNGTVAGWAAAGIDLNTANNVLIANLRVQNNQGAGLRTGTNSAVRDTVAEGNGANGLQVGISSLVSKVIAQDNGSTGILASSRSVVKDSTAYSNDAYGIYVGLFSEVLDAVSSNNGSDGIRVAGAAGTVSGCNVTNNGGDGIEVYGNSFVTGNNVYGQNAAGVAAIRMTGDANRIDGNVVNNNNIGILAVDGTAGNLIVRNSANGNTVNWNVGAGNFLPVAASPLLADAWDNFIH